MNIKEIVFMIYLYFINIYKNIIDLFKFKNIEDNSDNESVVSDAVRDSEPDSHNETQQYIEEIAEEVIERITEKYHLFKKE